MSFIEDLNTRMGIETEAGVAEIIAANGRLPAVTVKTAQGVEGTVYLHGAHVAAWVPEARGGGEEALWLSEKSLWDAGKPIRGGVPICFPWFGPNKNNPQAPAHGFARLATWELESIKQDGAAIVVTLATQSNDSTMALWPHHFRLRHRVSFANELVMALELTNTGAAPFTAEEALHTYFSVGDIRQVRVTGLSATNYIDKVDQMREKIQDGDIAITGETDRVYLETTAPVTIHDPAKGRSITVAKENSRATVVWNPWIAKAKAMPDFGDEEWAGMICVETCNVGPAAVRVEPDQTHIMTTRVRLNSL